MSLEKLERIPILLKMNKVRHPEKQKNQKENTLMVIEKGYGNIGIQKVQKKKRLILLMATKVSLVLKNLGLKSQNLLEL